MELWTDVAGKHLRLRTANEDDAEFILSLRLDPELSRFINETDPSIEKQRAWIRQRREAPDDYHMIIQTHDRRRLGTIAVYNIDAVDNTFEWGRWIIHRAAPFYTALESALLCYQLAFVDLRLATAIFGTNKQNTRVISFNLKLGAKVCRTTTDAVWFRFTKEDFVRIKPRYKRYIDDAG
jgi:RimJ/RimL family protein N-acetyltransferase